MANGTSHRPEILDDDLDALWHGAQRRFEAVELIRRRCTY
jgi:hypothetical protein